tara:strand:- start:309 stop:455 length:147 start_codon:yes stop_codon:yes gene_type:complete
LGDEETRRQALLLLLLLLTGKARGMTMVEVLAKEETVSAWFGVLHTMP